MTKQLGNGRMDAMTDVDVATLDALMAQPFAVGIRREQMHRIWDAFWEDALDWTHANALRVILTPDSILPPYVDLFNAALVRIVEGDKAREEEGRRLAQSTIQAGDAKWAQITNEAAGLRRASLT